MERLRPAVRAAAQALCAAEAPGSALACNVRALDLACFRAGFGDLAGRALMEDEPVAEVHALAEALLCHMPVATLVGILRCTDDARALTLGASLFILPTFRGLGLPQAALLLDNRAVLRALLDALIAADATAAPDVPVAGGAETRSGLPKVPPMLPLDDLLIAVYELLKQWPRRRVRLMEETSRRDGLMRCLVRRYRPDARRADVGGAEGCVHRSAATLLQGLSVSVTTCPLVWDSPPLMRAMHYCLKTQARDPMHLLARNARLLAAE